MKRKERTQGMVPAVEQLSKSQELSFVVLTTDKIAIQERETDVG